MNFAIIGYGRMGKTIEKILKDRNHVISCIVDPTNDRKVTDLKDYQIDAAIEFTSPDSAPENIKACIQMGIPVISGSTGWLDKLDEVKELVRDKNGTFFYASNFSLGVNLFFKLNEYLARLMNNAPGYLAEIEEIHHTQKLDKPSGTAISLADGILKEHQALSSWKLDEGNGKEVIPVVAVREPDVPGTHTVKYSSDEDQIEIRHTAKGREGFALGAVVVAEWATTRTGFLTMEDYLKF